MLPSRKVSQTLQRVVLKQRARNRCRSSSLDFVAYSAAVRWGLICRYRFRYSTGGQLLSSTNCG